MQCECRARAFDDTQLPVRRRRSATRSDRLSLRRHEDDDTTGSAPGDSSRRQMAPMFFDCTAPHVVVNGRAERCVCARASPRGGKCCSSQRHAVCGGRDRSVGVSGRRNGAPPNKVPQRGPVHAVHVRRGTPAVGGLPAAVPVAPASPRWWCWPSVGVQRSHVRSLHGCSCTCHSLAGKVARPNSLTGKVDV